MEDLNLNWILVTNHKKKHSLAIKLFNEFYRKYKTTPIKIISSIELNENIKSNYSLFILDDIKNKLVREFIYKDYLDKPIKEQSYSFSIDISPYNKEQRVIIVTGYDYCGLLYGLIDLINIYFKEKIYTQSKWRYQSLELYQFPFTKGMTPFKRSSSPSILERGGWTWGFCIYDYKKYFINMLKMKLNLIVIWNDFVPKNAKEIIDFAHKCGIKVIFGFSWGWEDKNAIVTDFSKLENKKIWAKKIINTYIKEYKALNIDGIYFQTFTERNESKINNHIVAKLATSWVNYISNELFKVEPNLRLQFGIHSTSIKNDIKYLVDLDPRVELVYEDCGSVPFNYLVNENSDVKETINFVKNVSLLRNKEKPSFVIKGFSTLDWKNFKHHDENIIIGHKSKNFINNKIKEKEQSWHLLNGLWQEGIKDTKIILEELYKTNNKVSFQLLIEDCPIEGNIYYSIALVSELLWSLNSNLEEVEKRALIMSK